jgi:hypothetical protein
MIAAADRDDALRSLRRRHGKHLVEGAARLERSRLLQAFQLHINLRAKMFAQRARRHERRTMNQAAKTPLGLTDEVE